MALFSYRFWCFSDHIFLPLFLSLVYLFTSQVRLLLLTKPLFILFGLGGCDRITVYCHPKMMYTLDGFCLFVIYVRYWTQRAKDRFHCTNAQFFFWLLELRVNNLYRTMKWLFWYEFVWKRQMTVDNFYAHLIQQRCRTIN